MMMDSLPPEVIHIICTHLSVKDAASLRLVNHKVAGVAAHYIVHRVRCHTTLESLKRLHDIANHEVFGKTVKTVVYEGSTIANIGCVHAYTSHFEDEAHHAMEKPIKPSYNASARELRLYQRNKAKFDQDILSKYQDYRSRFDAQQELLTSKPLRTLISDSMSKFVNLTDIEYSPMRRCSHLTSKRFNEDFGTTCAVPMTSDALQSFSIVKHMLLDGGSINTSLRTIRFEHLSPKFFSGSIAKASLIAAFQNLTSITLSFKPSSQDIVNEDEMPEDIIKRHLGKGILRDALAAATHLTHLEIEFVTNAQVSISDSTIFADGVSWPELSTLALLSVSTTQSRFTDILKRQPCLETLRLLFIDLSEGTWEEVLNIIKKEQRLKWFHADGFISDSCEFYPMDHIFEPLYAEEHLVMTLGEAIDDYVTTSCEDGPPNPLGDEFKHYQDEDYVFETYGIPAGDVVDSDDTDFHSDMDLDDENNDFDEEMTDFDEVLDSVSASLSNFGTRNS